MRRVEDLLEDRGDDYEKISRIRKKLRRIVASYLRLYFGTLTSVLLSSSPLNNLVRRLKDHTWSLYSASLPLRAVG